MLKERTHEYLRYEFTLAERTELGSELAQVTQKLATAEETKKQVTATITAQIQDHKTEQSRLTRLLNNRCEYRTVECAVEYDTPEGGLKRVVRLDTGEEVRVEKMTDEDRQAQLPLATGVGA